MVKVSKKYHIRKTGVGKLRIRHNHGSQWSGLRNSMLYNHKTEDWVEDDWCSRCKKDTPHQIEDIMVGESPSRNAMDREFTCLKCGNVHTIEDITSDKGDEAWERENER